MDRFDLAEQNRNAILKYSKKFKDRTFNHRMAALALKLTTDVVYRCCRAMERDEEMKALGFGKNIRFKGIADKTMSADDMRDRAANKKGNWNRANRESKRPNEPWRITNRSEDNKPIPNQGGQGALINRYGFSTLEYI